MKKLLLYLFSFIAYIHLSAQSLPNPYESIGKKAPKISTTSNGEFEEFFKKDTLVQIGSTIMNRYTGEVVFLEEYNSEKLKQFTGHNEKNFRFLSIDPLTRNFPYWTPYQYASNMPIKAIDLDGLEAYAGPNDAKDVMSLDSWQQFANTKFSTIKHTDLKARPQYDCADFVVTIMAEYYKEKGVRLVLSIPSANGTITLDSNDPKYKGENAFNDFVEDIKVNTGAKWVRDELSTKIPLEDFAVGDMYNFGFHVGYNYPDAANPPSEPFGVIDASGSYYGKDATNNDIKPVALRSYEEISGNVLYRWSFLSNVPKSQPDDMEYMTPIQIKSIPVQQEEKTISMPNEPH